MNTITARYNQMINNSAMFSMYKELLVPITTDPKDILRVVREKGANEFIEGMAAAVLEITWNGK